MPAEAMRLMGFTTKQEAVNAALKEYLAPNRRLVAAARVIGFSDTRPPVGQPFVPLPPFRSVDRVW